MAQRPVFIPKAAPVPTTMELSFEIQWHPGFALVQKQKNILGLHEAAASAGHAPMLEVSTKSTSAIGRRLSAFSLEIRTEHHGTISIECAFQGSKVFQCGGPYTDLYRTDPRSAKRDPRIRSSGDIVGFRYEGLDFPASPRTAFYDWLYISALYPHREFLSDALSSYAGFTDIEFNPQRSLNCQARSCAFLAALIKARALTDEILQPARFVKAAEESAASQRLDSNSDQLFG